MEIISFPIYWHINVVPKELYAFVLSLWPSHLRINKLNKKVNQNRKDFFVFYFIYDEHQNFKQNEFLPS